MMSGATSIAHAVCVASPSCAARAAPRTSAVDQAIECRATARRGPPDASMRACPGPRASRQKQVAASGRTSARKVPARIVPRRYAGCHRRAKQRDGRELANRAWLVRAVGCGDDHDLPHAIEGHREGHDCEVEPEAADPFDRQSPANHANAPSVAPAGKVAAAPATVTMTRVRRFTTAGTDVLAAAWRDTRLHNGPRTIGMPPAGSGRAAMSIPPQANGPAQRCVPSLDVGPAGSGGQFFDLYQSCGARAGVSHLVSREHSRAARERLLHDERKSLARAWQDQHVRGCQRLCKIRLRESA